MSSFTQVVISQNEPQLLIRLEKKARTAGQALLLVSCQARKTLRAGLSSAPYSKTDTLFQFPHVNVNFTFSPDFQSRHLLVTDEYLALLPFWNLQLTAEGK